MFKRLLNSVTIAPVIVVGMGAVAAAEGQYLDKAPESIALDIQALQLPSVILKDIPQASTIISALEEKGVDFDYAYYKKTKNIRYSLSGNNSTLLIAAPERFKDIPNLSQAYECGVNLGYVEGINLYNFAQPYESETKPESDPRHRFVMKRFNADALDKGIAYLKDHTYDECWKVAVTSQLHKPRMGNLGPKLIP